MGAKHDELYKKALAAIKELYSDTSVSHQKTEGALRQLVEEIDVMIEACQTNGGEEEEEE